MEENIKMDLREVGLCEHGNKPSRFIKGRIMLYQLSEYQPFKNDSAP
jgi:hypothetical protein